MMKLFCIVLVILALQDFQQVNAVGRGEKCKRDSNCDDGLFCCSPEGFWRWKKRCYECCKNTNCEKGYKCKDRQCIRRLG
eukprot:14136.XXX_274627_274941_1 [CDS] Oithona nana genome sequencing.